MKRFDLKIWKMYFKKEEECRLYLATSCSVTQVCGVAGRKLVLARWPTENCSDFEPELGNALGSDKPTSS
jgi:hypothetical protein